MSRVIDTVPEPDVMLEKKVIILSRSRVGTFSMYQAMNQLGYKACHIYDIFHSGVTPTKLFDEAIRCKYMGAGKPYGKKEFDKWLARYDALVEIPQFFVEEMIEFYPNAKFIVTERDLDAWRKSFSKTIDPATDLLRTWPMRTLEKIDEHLKSFSLLVEAMEYVWYRGSTHKDPLGVEMAKEDLQNITKKARELLPEKKLLVCKLEDGFGWEEMCPFLGLDIPKEKYPRGNGPEEFDKLFWSFITPPIIKGSLMLATGIAVPVLSWVYLK